MILLNTDNLSLYIQKQCLLKDLSLSLESGQVTSIIGPSPSGKSTLAYALSNARSLHLKEKIATFTQSITLIPQDPKPSLCPNRKVKLQLEDIQQQQQNPIPLKTLLSYLDINLDLLDTYPTKLSIGQAQAISIIFAIATQPKLIIADEPTASLDSKRKKLFNKLVETLSKQGIAILILSRHLTEYAHQTFYIHNKQLSTSRPTAITNSHTPHPPLDSNILTLHNFSVAHAHNTIITPFTANVAKQSCVGIIGDNGSGKSSLLKAIMQLMPHTGKILLNNQRCHTQAIRKHIQLMFQSPQTTFNPLYPITALYDDPTVDITILNAILKEFKLSLKPLYPQKISQGEAQVIAFARIIARNPDILLLDEPTSAMSPYLSEITIDIIKQLQQDGKTFLITSHQQQILKQLCHTTWIIKEKCLNIQPLLPVSTIASFV